ncbi:acyl-[acyl-carrier-protein]--UDP-N-acetylglucosamine O-acyltransferase [Hydrogenispora ethanolica]|jgi:UDP-N-acetylglucosamine acyltransferase|uniref:Acyl-[acyl-carrier-protein]--UDP-N-acetylglucosamine O-acyltransferase n=1 Tax=Hydrogenispora ethanolica TaxID=1082276 RepID=A0A4R1RW44_HYDET|nr:acyl-ACP--UDP-N-acetylglucosamine O-acyltransferase [Hydrogenispora ethanolica]TCL70898.1 acyl-[acyl-carrier-protein]--UDP-N-acetylglucosamine O-acyltransferase [Hydrogenispora ethanolica]
MKTKNNFRTRDIHRIHPTAVVHPNAKIGWNVTIGPYAVIGENVTIGDHCMVGPHVSIDGWTTIGQGNRFFHGASIGYEPQDLKFKNQKTFLFIGDNNIFREYTTVNRGTEQGGGETRLGNNNVLMLYSHVAHDCHVGNGNLLENGSALGGHVMLEDHVVVGWMSGIHQFCKIGSIVTIGLMTKVTKDVPPFILVEGNPAKVAGLNEVGLRKNGIPPEVFTQIQLAYQILYHSKLALHKAIEEMEFKLQSSLEIDHFIRFILNNKRGIQR